MGEMTLEELTDEFLVLKATVDDLVAGLDDLEVRIDAIQEALYTGELVEEDE